MKIKNINYSERFGYTYLYRRVYHIHRSWRSILFIRSPSWNNKNKNLGWTKCIRVHESHPYRRQINWYMRCVRLTSSMGNWNENIWKNVGVAAVILLTIYKFKEDVLSLSWSCSVKAKSGPFTTFFDSFEWDWEWEAKRTSKANMIIICFGWS